MAAVETKPRNHALSSLFRDPRSVINLCGWFFLIVCCVGYLWYINDNVFDYISADASNVLVLSDYLWQNGEIVADDYYYSTELYVLYEQLVYIPLFGLFPNDWHQIRIVGTAILLMMLLLCFYFLCTTLKLKKEYPWLASVLVLPISTSYGIYVLILTYYYFYVFVSMIIVGIALRLASEDLSLRKLFNVFLFLTGGVLGFLEGLGGLRILVNVILPLSIAIGISMLLYPMSRKEKQRLGLFAAVLLASSMLGYALNATVITQMFSFQDFGLKNWTEFDFERLVEVWNGVLSLFGYQPDVSLSSKRTITNLMSLATFLASIFVLIKMVRPKVDVDLPHRLLAVFLGCSLVVLTGIYSFSSMEYKARYLIPTCIFFVPLVASALKSLIRRISGRWNPAAPVIVACLAFCVVIMGLAGYKSTAHSGEYPRAENYALVDVVDHVRNEGYSKGYSTFSYGGRITEFSNGAIEMWCFKGYVEDSGIQKMTGIHDIYQWLQPRAHSEEFPEEAFILFSKKEISRQPYAQQFAALTPLYENELFIVFDQSTAEQMS